MSVAAMIDTKLVREKRAAEAAGGGAAGAGGAAAGAGAAAAAAGAGEAAPAPVGVPTGIVNQLTRWIPSESILLYVALLAAFGQITPATGQKIYQFDFTSRWIALGVFVAVTEVLVLGLSYGKSKRNNLPFHWPTFELLIAPVAFVGWAIALPDTPLLNFKGYNTAVGGFVLLCVTVGAAVAAYIFNQSPDYETVVTG